MKGVVFVELLAMADEAVGEAVVDRVVARCPLMSKGAYTTVGTYPVSELNQLVEGFSEQTGASVEALQHKFGQWMLGRFADGYPDFFKAQPDAFAMLESVETEVHTEVRKLYPDAELPTFETRRLAPDTLQMIYRSPRRLQAFCQGLIEACLAHYGETAEITRVDHATADLVEAEFTIRRMAVQPC